MKLHFHYYRERESKVQKIVTDTEFQVPAPVMGKMETVTNPRESI